MAAKKVPTKDMVLYSLGPLADQTSHQAFQFLIFVFYYTVVGVNVNIIMWSFIIFAVWDSINDPLLGPISDRTKSKFGRRRFWVLVSLVPFAVVNLILFTPPGYGRGDLVNAVYMIFTIMTYDLFYSLFTMQEFAIFPEMFKDPDDRRHAGMIKNIFTVIGVIFGFVLPTFIINPLSPDPATPPAQIDAEIERIQGMYIINGIFLMILVLVFGFLFFKVGMKEAPSNVPQEFPDEASQEDRTHGTSNSEPSIWQSLKLTLKNKGFIVFIIGNMFNWFVFKLLTAIIPLYGEHVLGIGHGDIFLSLILLVALLSAAFFSPLMEILGRKIGNRNAFMVAEGIWMVSLIPFWFLDNQPILAMIFMIPVGIGLSGAMFFIDVVISDVIDEDELATGENRAGSYYGVNALIHRYSTILVFVAIAVVLTGYGWEEYIIGPGADFEALRAGLKLLMVVFPIGGICIVILCLKIFPLHGKRLDEMREKLAVKRAADSTL